MIIRDFYRLPASINVDKGEIIKLRRMYVAKAVQHAAFCLSGSSDRSSSPESREALEKWKRDMESRPPIEEDPKAMEGIKDLWVGYPALSTLEIAERIGYPYEAVSGAIKRMLQKGDLEPRGHLSSKPRKRV